MDIYFSPYELYNFQLFVSKLDTTIPCLTRFSVLVRVCFGYDATFRMLGKQIGFLIDDPSTKGIRFLELHNNVLFRLDSSMLNYNFTGDHIITLQLLFYKLQYTDKIIKNVNNPITHGLLGDNKDLANVSKKTFDLECNNLIPLTMNIKDYPPKLHTVAKDGLIKSVFINDGFVDFSQLINSKNSILNKEDDIKLYDSLYIYRDIKSKYVVTLERSYLNDAEQNNITVYTSEGSKVLNITDRYLDHTHFTRSIGNITNTINNKKLVTRVSIKLDAVRVNKTANKFNNLSVNDPFIGTLDLETYKTKDISKVYAIGFYTKRYGVQTFYIDVNTLDSNKLIMNCLDSMLISKYNGYTFYTHNLGKFDVTFILKTLVIAKKQEYGYKLELISRDDQILCLTIGKKVGTKTYTIKIIDSYNILTHSLTKLCKTYETAMWKDVFPYSFVTDNTLFYVATKPSITHYKIDSNNYDDIPNNGWSTQK